MPAQALRKPQWRCVAASCNIQARSPVNCDTVTSPGLNPSRGRAEQIPQEIRMSLKFDPRSFPDPDSAADAGSAGDTIVLAGGCFWCTESVYRQLDGVSSVRPGYAGGAAHTANYQDVCSGDTGHAEAIEIRFDPSRVTLGQILKIFFSIAHDPTQVNRQGADVGTQYRSAIFFANEAQRRIAERYIHQIDAAGIFDAPVATTLEPLEQFFEAEQYHHDYAARNPHQPYIRAVSAPKVEKLRATHGDMLRRCP
jgi:peptide-methionine (S)-S-oxide reductase